jgi:predicted SprT family Zn-dependent metalloprotease
VRWLENKNSLEAHPIEMFELMKHPRTTVMHKLEHTHIWWMGGKNGNAKQKDTKKSLLSNVGKIQRQMSRTMIYVKETRKHIENDTMGLA